MPYISKSDIVFVVADTHFNNKSKTKDIKDFFFFLKKVRKEGSKLFLLGDIFDFYFEYKTVIPKVYFKVFCEFQKTIDRGIEIHYWAGNHDFWLGEFIHNLNIITHFNPEIFSMDEYRILVEHGNELHSSELLDMILRNRLSKFLFSCIHPDLGINIAGKISKLSRMRSEKISFNYNSLFKYAEKKFKSDVDAIIMGHFHRPYVYKKSGKTLIVLGDWSNYRSFGIVSRGKISIKRFNHSPR
jgi:UDP-2,3-diacylglucosamine hydrolase